VQQATDAAQQAQQSAAALTSQMAALTDATTAVRLTVARLDSLVYGLPLDTFTPGVARLSKHHRTAPMIRTKRVTADRLTPDQRTCALQPSHCLSCQQPMPYAPPPPPPHEALGPTAATALADGHSGRATPRSEGASLSASSRTPVPSLFLAAEPSYHAKLAFGREAANDARQRTHEQLAEARVRTRPHDKPAAAVLGQSSTIGARPASASAPALNRTLRTSASAAASGDPSSRRPQG
jgi:hypothetical protein